MLLFSVTSRKFRPQKATSSSSSSSLSQLIASADSWGVDSLTPTEYLLLSSSYYY